MKRFYPILLMCSICLFCSNGLMAQKAGGPEQKVISQTVKGSVVDFQSRMPIQRASVAIVDAKTGAYTDKNGEFRIAKVPVGRHTVRISYVGYEPFLTQIVLTSGKELVINAELTQTVVTSESVRVVADNGNGGLAPINPSAIVSSTQFSVDDVERFAGSRMDPARMAQNFAGVLGANDQRNDIIIRGGAPTELLWRLDGLDIPNPNHFATQGATGGPVCALNSNLLSNSDFFTGAFPAEYGDKLSGVFDLRTRKGNKDKYEFMGQLGFNGIEAGAEGPLGISDGSFIANYRYSFLDFLDAIGLDFGFSGIPRYQDGTLKLNISSDESNRFSLTGIFGISDIDIKDSKEDDVVTGDFDTQSGTDFYAIGATWEHIFSESFYSKLTLGSVFTKYRTTDDSITAANNKPIDFTRWFTMNSSDGYHTAKYEVFYTPARGHFLSAGVESRYKFYDFDQSRTTPSSDDTVPYKVREKGNAMNVLGYVNWNWRILSNLTVNAGLSAQYLEISKQSSLEPRISASWSPIEGHSFSAGFGVHRQSLPLSAYFEKPGNTGLDFMQSVHYVAGYSVVLSASSLFKVEGYFKDLSHIPIERNKPSYWSFVNAGTGFGTVDTPGELISTGTGKAYGAELSFIKHFDHGWYLNATASYVRQQYKGSDGVSRWGKFDNQYIFNILAGYEYKVSQRFTIESSIRWTTAGGSPYIPIDLARSIQTNDTEYDKPNAYTVRLPDYHRFDIRIDFRQNFDGFSLISYISVENLLNRKNLLGRKYDSSNKSIKDINQLGIFPIGGIKIEF